MKAHEQVCGYVRDDQNDMDWDEEEQSSSCPSSAGWEPDHPLASSASSSCSEPLDEAQEEMDVGSSTEGQGKGNSKRTTTKTANLTGPSRQLLDCLKQYRADPCDGTLEELKRALGQSGGSEVPELLGMESPPAPDFMIDLAAARLFTPTQLKKTHDRVPIHERKQKGSANILCLACKQYKKLGDFYIHKVGHNKGKPHNMCKVCKTAKSRSNLEEHPSNYFSKQLVNMTTNSRCRGGQASRRNPPEWTSSREYLEFVSRRLVRQKGCCAISGIRFDEHSWISVERNDESKSYTEGNVSFILKPLQSRGGNAQWTRCKYLEVETLRLQSSSQEQDIAGIVATARGSRHARPTRITSRPSRQEQWEESQH